MMTQGVGSGLSLGIGKCAASTGQGQMGQLGEPLDGKGSAQS